MVYSQMITIRTIQPEDRDAVYALAMRSKAVWGYTEPQMAAFRIEVEEMFDAADSGFVAEMEREIVAYYTLVVRNKKQIELDHLFVDAGRMKQRIGTQLMEHAINTARSGGYKVMSLINDPNAPGFYEKFGARKIGDHCSSLTGRMIPIMEIEL